MTETATSPFPSMVLVMKGGGEGHCFKDSSIGVHEVHAIPLVLQQNGVANFKPGSEDPYRHEWKLSLMYGYASRLSCSYLRGNGQMTDTYSNVPFSQ